MKKSIVEHLQEICRKLVRYEEYTVEIGISISFVLHEAPYMEYDELHMDGDNQLTVRLDDITEVREHPRDEYDLEDEWRVTLISASWGRIDIDAYGRKAQP
ncbi:MAG: hypothetical protein LUH00_08315 [Lachnospiraceae bacterium]|nr:hypothetical protein [Lachnospiraceae bacterium]